jgi:predicted solute-binding protein
MRLGCLPYLNVKPLVYTLEHGELPVGWELVYAPPSELAEMLVRDEIAAAPVSSFATFIYPELEICPGICIASDGPVKSVLLMSNLPIEKLNTVALDTSSLSGANMLKIILDEVFHVRPEFVRMSPRFVSEMLEQCDAAMVIGNPAMLYPKDGLHVVDLGEEWKKLTGLPAVFAVWAGRRMTPELIEVLDCAKRIGISKIDEIAAEESGKLGLPFEVCWDYLARIMVYDLGDREARGLRAFHEKSILHGLVDSGIYAL